MPCPRCTADPQPGGEGWTSSPRSCAFNADGEFTERNWNCATITALLELDRDPTGYRDPFFGTPSILGNDESMDLIHVPEDVYGGWIVLNRYKRRGRTSSAVHVGDFWPARPLTLALAEAVLATSHKPVSTTSSSPEQES